MQRRGTNQTLTGDICTEIGTYQNYYDLIQDALSSKKIAAQKLPGLAV
jgi:hypothetical protein